MLIESTVRHSAENLLSLISEEDQELLNICLVSVNKNLPLFWPEFHDAIHFFEKHANNSDFIYFRLAALVTSKIYFYAHNLDLALNYALIAADMFDPYYETEYNETIIFKCFEKYIEIRRHKIGYHFERELHEIVMRVIDNSIKRKYYFSVIGLAIEMRSIEILESTVLASNKDPKLLAFCVTCVHRSPDNLDFRTQVLKSVLALYSSQENHSLVDVAQYLFMLDDHPKLIQILKRLIYSDPPLAADLPVALQICFDIYQNASQQDLQEIINDLQTEASMKTAELIEAGVIDTSNFDESNEATIAASGVDYKTLPYLKNLNKLVSILEGNEPNKLQLYFMIKSLRYDVGLIKNMQNSRLPTSHTATAVCNGLVHLGTASDTLIRTNIEWISWSVGWGRFVMVASLGVIHKGHGEVVIKILQPYLPSSNKEHVSSHHEGGAFYAIGLSYANYGNSITNYFLPHTLSKMDNIVQHGYALGLGLAAMGTNKINLYEIMVQILQEDEAVSGEAAGIASGLIMLGSARADLFDQLFEFMRKTKHEKIQRGLALGVAMIFALKTDSANPFIQKLLDSFIPIQRMAGVYVCALAYAGTNDSYAVKKLWKTAVSDTYDDVKRVAMIGLGLVMLKEPEKFLGIALLFLQTYNAYLRCGTLMALGIVFAGSGDDNILNLVKSLFIDGSFIVRQSAFIAAGMIMVQRNEKTTECYRDIRSILVNVCTDRRTDTIAKFGGYVGYGIMDAGCRNQALTFLTLEGHTRVASIVGFMVFQQFWYWFPLVHFISLCFVPTSIILVDPELHTPKIKFLCDIDQSLFSYPTFAEKHKKERDEKIRPSQLSVSMRNIGKRRNISLKEHDANFVSRGVNLKKTRTTHSNRTSVTKAEDSKKAPVFSIKSILSQKTEAEKTKQQTESGSAPESKTSEAPETIPTSTENEKSEKKKNDEHPEKVSDKPGWFDNPIRSLPHQLKHMKIDPESGEVHTVKPVTCGGIIVCYSENMLKRDNSKTKPIEMDVEFHDDKKE